MDENTRKKLYIAIYTPYKVGIFKITYGASYYAGKLVHTDNLRAKMKPLVQYFTSDSGFGILAWNYSDKYMFLILDTDCGYTTTYIQVSGDSFLTKLYVILSNNPPKPPWENNFPNSHGHFCI